MRSRPPRPASIRRRITDLYSRIVPAHIFEAPLRVRLPGAAGASWSRTAAALPEISADFRASRSASSRGIYFADDPAFKGQRRELTAPTSPIHDQAPLRPGEQEPELRLQLDDADPRPGRAAHGRRSTASKPFDYDREVRGLRALDRYTFEIQLAVPRPRFITRSPTPAASPARVAREVVEDYGDRISEHPVGTGPFRLEEWRRSSRIVLERNPAYREVLLRRAARAPATPTAQAIAARSRAGACRWSTGRGLDHRGERSRAGWRS